MPRCPAERREGVGAQPVGRALRRSARLLHHLPGTLRSNAVDEHPGHLREAVADAYAALPGDAPAVAVRSSAVDEDGDTTSFAGVHETYLNIRGSEALLVAVGGCLESFFGERALAYRRERGIDGMPRAAVLVQQQVVSDVSIVAFSANPISRAPDEIVVTASWGLGESIVGGSVTPDTWILRRDGQVREERIGDKRRMTVAVDGGAREVDVPRVLREVASLRREQLAEVAELAAALERQTGRPVDIECAYAGGRLFLLQCRPITTLSATSDREGPSARGEIVSVPAGVAGGASERGRRS